ncbi:uncharacterized protein LOC122499216 [Leptopilina heterotoma]|uniref:uncharacterized protein LOC122499216 n=1 Tax=Leptopilina heterotoma TaxID=63436 RepID=UPI001CA99E33|nr:uncharacterized protein LOC122499216 [Leptopilina heterotoma]
MSTKNNLGVDESIFTVIEMLEIMLRSKKETQEDCAFADYLRIEIKLQKREKEYLIQILNTDLFKDEHFDIVLELKNHFKAKIMFKTENEFNFKNKIDAENLITLESSDETESAAEILPYLGKSFYIQLQKKLNSEHLEEFQSLVINKIHALNKLHSNVNFTFLRDSIFLHDDGAEYKKGEELCDFVSSTFLNIVKQSQREEYRRKTFNLFNANSFEELNYSIKRYLLSQIYGEKIAIKQRS